MEELTYTTIFSSAIRQLATSSTVGVCLDEAGELVVHPTSAPSPSSARSRMATPSPRAGPALHSANSRTSLGQEGSSYFTAMAWDHDTMVAAGSPMYNKAGPFPAQSLSAKRTNVASRRIVSSANITGAYVILTEINADPVTGAAESVFVSAYDFVGARDEEVSVAASPVTASPRNPANSSSGADDRDNVDVAIQSVYHTPTPPPGRPIEGSSTFLRPSAHMGVEHASSCMNSNVLRQSVGATGGVPGSPLASTMPLIIKDNNVDQEHNVLDDSVLTGVSAATPERPGSASYFTPTPPTGRRLSTASHHHHHHHVRAMPNLSASCGLANDGGPSAAAPPPPNRTVTTQRIPQFALQWQTSAVTFPSSSAGAGYASGLQVLTAIDEGGEGRIVAVACATAAGADVAHPLAGWGACARGTSDRGGASHGFAGHDGVPFSQGLEVDPVAIAVGGEAVYTASGPEMRLQVWDPYSGVRQREGGLLAPGGTATVTTIRHDAREGLLNVGMTDGTVRLLSTDSLAPLRLVTTLRISSSPVLAISRARGADGVSVCVTSDGVWGFSLRTFEVVAVAPFPPEMTPNRVVAAAVEDEAMERVSVAAAGLEDPVARIDVVVFALPPVVVGRAPSHSHRTSIPDAPTSDISTPLDDGVGHPFGAAAGAAGARERGGRPFVALDDESPLPAELTTPVALLAERAKDPKDKPVTFNRGGPVKSSGYTNTNVPWSVQQAAKDAKKKLAAKRQQEAADAARQVAPMARPTFNTASPPVSVPVAGALHHLDKHPLHTGAVTSVAFDTTGSLIVTGGNDGVVSVLRLPSSNAAAAWEKAVAKVVAFPVRERSDSIADAVPGPAVPVVALDVAARDGTFDGGVYGADTAPSKDPFAAGPLMFAAGTSDGLVALYRPAGANAAPGRGGTAAVVTTRMPRAVRDVRFALANELLLVAAGSQLSVHRYALDLEQSELDRGRNRSVIQRVAAYGTGGGTGGGGVLRGALAAAAGGGSAAVGGQSVSCFDTFNTIRSSRVVIGTSSRQVGLLDLHDLARPVWIAEDAHSRGAIVAVALNRSSHFADASDDTTCLFASASLDSTVRLWDMRIGPRAVRVLSKHQNTSTRVALAFSPCGQYLSTGSEDRTLCVYDVGSGEVVARPRMRDVPTAASHSPLRALAAVGCADGCVRFFHAGE